MQLAAKASHAVTGTAMPSVHVRMYVCIRMYICTYMVAIGGNIQQTHVRTYMSMHMTGRQECFNTKNADTKSA